MPMPRKPREPCRNCGTLLPRRPRVFCGLPCQNEFAYRHFVERWLSGNTDGTKVGGVSNHVRRYLIETLGEKCSLCSWCERNPATGRVPVEVDHVDGDSRRSTLENLRLLCPNCHSLTPTFRNLNKGRGRKQRVKAQASLAQRSVQ